MRLKPLPHALLAAHALLALPLLSQASADTSTDVSIDGGIPSRYESQKLDGIEVVARGTASDVPDTLSTDLISWRDTPGAPGDVQDLLVRIPGVGATGQNGAFETFSIRGSGANGILVLLGGMPITAQRRAGVPISFIDPALLGALSVTRGPSTVHFGPGALGGAISIEPHWFDGSEFTAGYADAGDETLLMAGHGNESFSIGVARRRAGDGQAADGTPLNTSYRRDSASLQWQRAFGDFQFDASLLPSRTTDIGKSNSRFPQRDSTYPEDRHTLASLHLSHAGGFDLRVSGHDQSLLTWNQRPGSPDTWAYIESTDYGLTAQHTWQADAFAFNAGIEYLGRRDVTGYDARETPSNRTYSLHDASENLWSAFAIADWQLDDRLKVEAGARASRVSQSLSGASSSSSDTAFNLGAVWNLDSMQRLSLNLASGYRFPTLEERFFSGVTPQGEIVGNPNLGSEHSLGIDIGYGIRLGRWKVQANLWRTDVDDLIQLYELAPGVNGYTNIGEAQLHGFELSVGLQATEALQLSASAAIVRSKNELTGEPLYGAPPVTWTFDARHALGPGSLGLLYQHRARMDRPGFEEVERASVDLVDLDYKLPLGKHWNLQLYARNALDKTYFATPDELSALAPERSIGFNLRWSTY
ncbi:TonB-dependent receptor [Xanthomonadaceae bacterium XH05]|nr:TonB-dependent receptor [Xanthomonadaceae bacterium XH05]